MWQDHCYGILGESLRKIFEEASLCRKHGGEIIEDATWSDHGGRTMEAESLRRNHRGIMEKESRRMNHRVGVTQEIPVRGILEV